MTVPSLRLSVVSQVSLLVTLIAIVVLSLLVPFQSWLSFRGHLFL